MTPSHSFIFFYHRGLHHLRHFNIVYYSTTDNETLRTSCPPPRADEHDQPSKCRRTTHQMRTERSALLSYIYAITSTHIFVVYRQEWPT